MTTLNLGQDWKTTVDAPNNRLIIEYEPNGTQFELNEDGTLAPLDGAVGDGTQSGDFQSVSAGVVEIEPHANRPLWSQNDRNINVPSDYNTLQEAVNDLPQILRHRYIITVSDSYDASAEDIYVPPTITPHVAFGETQTTAALRINSDTPSTPEPLGSMFVDSVHGMSFSTAGWEWQGTNPFDNESAAIAAYGCSGRIRVENCPPATNLNATTGYLAYNSHMFVDDTDIGSSDVTDGFKTKHEGTLTAVDCSGTAAEYAASVNLGKIVTRGATVPNGASGFAQISTNTGMVMTDTHPDTGRPAVITRGNERGVVTSPDPSELVQSITVDITGPGASTTDDFSDNASATATFSWPVGFTAIPTVAPQSAVTANSVFFTVDQVDSSGARLVARNYSTKDKSAETFSIDVIAIGQV